MTDSRPGSRSTSGPWTLNTPSRRPALATVPQPPARQKTDSRRSISGRPEVKCDCSPVERLKWWDRWADRAWRAKNGRSGRPPDRPCSSTAARRLSRSAASTVDSPPTRSAEHRATAWIHRYCAGELPPRQNSNRGLLLSPTGRGSAPSSPGTPRRSGCPGPAGWPASPTRRRPMVRGRAWEPGRWAKRMLSWPGGTRG